VSFGDEPTALFRTPRHFCAAVLGGEPPADLDPDIRNLLGWAKGVYQQYFAQEHDVEITRFDAPHARRARAVEAKLLETNADLAELLMVSHYLTIAEVLDESSDTSDELDPDAVHEEVLEAVHELLDRLRLWAEARDRKRLHQEAAVAYGEFGRTIAALG
jgi:hypothetical protein